MEGQYFYSVPVTLTENPQIHTSISELAESESGDVVKNALRGYDPDGVIRGASFDLADDGSEGFAVDTKLGRFVLGTSRALTDEELERMSNGLKTNAWKTGALTDVQFHDDLLTMDTTRDFKEALTNSKSMRAEVSMGNGGPKHFYAIPFIVTDGPGLHDTAMEVANHEDANYLARSLSDASKAAGYELPEVCGKFDVVNDGSGDLVIGSRKGRFVLGTAEKLNERQLDFLSNEMARTSSHKAKVGIEDVGFYQGFFEVGGQTPKLHNEDVSATEKQKRWADSKYVGPAQKKMVNQKREELRQLPRQELVDRILKFSDREHLNVNAGGQKRDYPIGKMAEGIRDRDYQMTDKQYYTLIHHFAVDAVQNTKVVGVTKYQNDPERFEKKLIAGGNGCQEYETKFVLMPEPDNPYDANAVKVLVPTTDGDLHHMGYLPRDFVAAHPITESMEMEGNILDYSGGKFKTVSYQMPLDIERLDNMQKDRLQLTDTDLMGIGDLSLDMPDHPELASNYVYERSFHLSGFVTDIEKAERKLNENDFVRQLNGEFETMDPRRMTALDDAFQTVVSAKYAFTGEREGVFRMETSEALSANQAMIAEGFVNYLQEDGWIDSQVKASDWYEMDNGYSSFLPDRTPFKLVSGPLSLTDDDLGFDDAKTEGQQV